MPHNLYRKNAHATSALQNSKILYIKYYIKYFGIYFNLDAFK